MKKLFLTLFIMFGMFYGNSQTFTMVKDINPQSQYDFITHNASFKEINGKVYYIFYQTPSNKKGLYVSDGTEAGTYKITPDDVEVVSEILTTGGNNVYFFAKDSNGIEPWVYNSDTQSAYMIKEIIPSSVSNSQAEYAKFFSADENKAYFYCTDGVNGFEIWVTDGTEAGTYMVKDITPGSTSTSIYTEAPIFGNNLRDGKFYFFCFTQAAGYEPWVSDGTEAGTFMLADISPGAGSSAVSYTYNQFYNYNGAMYFFASQFNSYKYDLYKTDGTQAGTELVSNIFDTNHSVLNLFEKDGLLYIITTNNLPKLWSTDGTQSGTQLVTTFPDNFNFNTIDFQPVVVGGTIYLRLKGNDVGIELYKLDSSYTPVLVKDIFVGTSNGLSTIEYEDAKVLQAYDNKIWFMARTSSTETTQFWVSDGTEAGTQNLTLSLGGSAGNMDDYNLFASSFGVFCIYVKMGVSGSELYFYSNGSMSNNDFTKISEIKLFPNPTSSVLNFSEILNNIEIYSLDGKRVLTQNSVENVDVSEFSNGIYLIKARTEEDKEINLKFIKK